MRRLLIALAVAVSAIVGVRIVEDGDDSPRGSVTLVGDSLNVGVEPYLREELEGWGLASHNVVGRRLEEGVTALRGLRGSLAPVLVISLGTNDVDGDVAELAEQAEQALELAGPRRCVIWATVWAGGAHESFNAILRAAAARQANLELLDWAALVEDDPKLLAFDGVHGSAAGYARRAEETAARARECVSAD